jgi:hypothetical protein
LKEKGGKIITIPDYFDSKTFLLISQLLQTHPRRLNFERVKFIDIYGKRLVGLAKRIDSSPGRAGFSPQLKTNAFQD